MTEVLHTAVLFNLRGFSVHREEGINVEHAPSNIVFRDRVFIMIEVVTEAGGFELNEIHYREIEGKTMVVHEVPVEWHPVAFSEISESGTIRLIVFSEPDAFYREQSIIDIVEWLDPEMAYADPECFRESMESYMEAALLKRAA